MADALDHENPNIIWDLLRQWLFSSEIPDGIYADSLNLPSSAEENPNIHENPNFNWVNLLSSAHENPNIHENPNFNWVYLPSSPHENPNINENPNFNWVNLPSSAHENPNIHENPNFNWVNLPSSAHENPDIHWEPSKRLLSDDLRPNFVAIPNGFLENPNEFLGSLLENPNSHSENLDTSSGEKSDPVNLFRNQNMLEMISTDNISAIPSFSFEEIYDGYVMETGGGGTVSRNDLGDGGKKKTEASASKKRKWTNDEDRILIDLVNLYGDNWAKIATKLDRRDSKQCRDRWHNQLRPDLKSDPWTEEEEMRLLEAHMQYGNKWEQIAKHIPGKCGNTIKNHWNSIKRRKGSRRGTNKDENHAKSTLELYIKNTTNESYALPTPRPPLDTSHQPLGMATSTSPSIINISSTIAEPYTDPMTRYDEYDEEMAFLIDQLKEDTTENLYL